MKKIRLISFAIATILTSIIIISSCAKVDKNPVANWVCHCTVSFGGGTSTIVDIPYNSSTKNDATNNCSAAQNTYNTSGTPASCVLQ